MLLKLVTFLFFVNSSCKVLTHALNTTTNIQIIDRKLFFHWTVDDHIHNNSNIHFNVKYCPLNTRFQERGQACKKRNITVCEANYTQASGGVTWTHKSNLLQYLNQSRDILFSEKKEPRVSSFWSSTRNEFTCAVDNLQRSCYFDQHVLGYLLLEASVDQYKEIRAVTQNYPLEKPKNLTVSQLRDFDILVSWCDTYKCASYAAPDSYFAVLESNDGKTEKQEIFTLNGKSEKSWKCMFHGLTPYTLYTINVYGYKIVDDINGPTTRMVFRTNESAPSKGVSLHTPSGCQAKEKDSNVTIQWKLPPTKSRNGIIRHAVIELLENEINHIRNMTIHALNITEAILTDIEVGRKYKARVKVCTNVNWCSAFSEVDIFCEQTVRKQQKSPTSYNIVAVVVPLVAVVPMITIISLLCCCRSMFPLCCIKKSNISEIQLSEVVSQTSKEEDDTPKLIGIYDYLPSENDSAVT